VIRIVGESATSNTDVGSKILAEYSGLEGRGGGGARERSDSTHSSVCISGCGIITFKLQKKRVGVKVCAFAADVL
jgi:hypothetical protein